MPVMYDLTWNGDPLDAEFRFIRGGGYLEIQGKKYGRGLFHHYKAAQQLLWPQDEDHHRWSDLMLETILAERISVFMGARDCVSGDTRILNPRTGEMPTIEELFVQQKSPLVQTLLGPIRAGAPFLKGKRDLYEVILKNGTRFVATGGHHVLTEFGYLAVASLRIGQSLVAYDECLLRSTGALDRPTRGVNDRNSFGKVADLRGCYFPDWCPCDERPHRAEATCQGFVASRDDALLRNQGDWLQGHQADAEARSRSCREGDRLSIWDCSPLQKKPEAGQSPVCRETPLRVSDWSQPAWQCVCTGPPCGPVKESNERGEKRPMAFAFPENRVHGIAVQEIKRKKTDWFFDLHVPIANHYFAEGCIHHNTGKTHVAGARYALTDYFAFPDETLILISSTDVRGLELRVWGDIKDLHERAKQRHPWLPGWTVDSKHGIFTDQLDPAALERIRDLRKGIICIPCRTGNGEWVGIEKFVGIKQKRRRLVGDELQFMEHSYLNSLSNLDAGDFKGIFLGNPLGKSDPLDKIAEPLCGWNAHPEPKKTSTWRNKFGGITVNLVGTDSPNFDEPENKPIRYSYMINRTDEARVRTRWGQNSLQYWSQIMGVRKGGLDLFRVLTDEICRQFHAFDQAVWHGGTIVKLYALDAAFGGDRCVGGELKFGQLVTGQNAIQAGTPEQINIEVGGLLTPEEQIANAVKSRMAAAGIPSSNLFFDAGMYATLAMMIAKIVGNEANAINFGGPATNRPVSNDEFVYEKNGTRRLKLCNEAYSKFVTELWWSVRMVVQSNQMREMPESVVAEFAMREWTKVAGDKYELETKQECKKRMGESPDEADWMAIGVEGARRLGFIIERQRGLGDKPPDDWLAKELQKHREEVKKTEMTYA